VAAGKPQPLICPDALQRSLLQPAKCFGVPVSDERLWADVKVSGEHLRLFSEHNGHGVLVSVYNVNARHWIAPFEPVDNIEHGKAKAAAYAEAYLKHATKSALPMLKWIKSPSK
jgi:hypothetical protein